MAEDGTQEEFGSGEWQQVIETMIDSVSDWVNKYCRRHFIAQDYTEYYDGDGSQTLYLDHYPVNSVTALYLDSEGDFGSGTEVSSSDYRLSSEMGRVWLESTFLPYYPQSVKVVYSAGYADVASIPDDLKLAVLDDIKWRFRRWQNNQEGISSITIEGISENLVTDTQGLKSSMEVYKRYRRAGHGQAHT